jgi:uncharacterized protein (DUF342 family)
MADKFRNFAPPEVILHVYNDKEAYDNVTRWEAELQQIEGEFSALHKQLKALKEKEYSGTELSPSDEEDQAIILEKIALLQTAGRTISKELRAVRAKFTWIPRPIAADERLSK